MAFNVLLAQFDVAPIRNLIISRCKICDVTLGGGVASMEAMRARPYVHSFEHNLGIRLGLRGHYSIL